MKHGIRILSLLLVLTLLFSLVPAVSAETTVESHLDRTTLSYEGTTAFGKLLAEGMNEYQASQTEDPSWISDVEVVDNIAWIDIAPERDALVLVGVYDEITGEMVTSGNVPVGYMDSTVTVELNGLPAYYELKIYVVDAFTYEPLCGAYTSTYYTKSIQELLAKTVDDFDADRVLQMTDSTETNFAVYAEQTVVVTQTNAVSCNLSSVAGNKYTFMLPNSALQSVKAGDILLYNSYAGETTIIKVASVSHAPGRSVITAAEDLEMSDVFDFIKIDTVMDGSSTEVDDSSMDEGVVYTGMEIVEPNRLLSAGEKVGTQVFVGFKFEDVKLGDSGLTLGGSLGLTLSAEFEYYFAALDETNSSDTTYVRLQAGYDAGVELNVKGSFMEEEVKLGDILLFSFYGVNVKVQPYFVASAEAKVSVTLTYSGTLGFKFETTGLGSYSLDSLYTKPKLKSELTVEGTFFVGVKFEPLVNVLSDDFFKAGVGFKCGLEIKGKLVGKGLYPEETHECYYCIDGSIRLKATLNVSIKLCKYISLVDVDLINYERFLADFYWSLDNSEFGFGDCPNNPDAKPSILEGAIPRAGGSCGDNLNWVFYDTGAIYITGYGPMDDYDGILDETPWADYTEEILYVIVDEGAESIGGAAFDDCTNLFSVTLPDSLMWIGRYAFSYCHSLEAIEIPGDLDYIDAYAFVDCPSLAEVTFNGSVEQIRASAFKYCTALQSIKLPTGLEKLSAEAFYGCTELRSVDFPYTLVEIDHDAFYDCTALTSVDLPDRLTVLGESVFSGCSSLEYVYIGDGLTELQSNTFADCPKLNDLWLGNNMKTIGWGAFWCCTGLSYVEIPDSVTLIDQYAFVSCDKLEYVDFGDSVRTIGYSAFKNCDALEEVYCPDSLITIGKFAFEGCDNLSTVRFSPNLETINTGAFLNCISLQEAIMPDTVTTLADEAFNGCTSLETVVMSDGLTEMGSSVFSDCYALTDVTIGTGLEELGSNTFWCCSSLAYIEVPGNIKALGSYTFTACDSLTTVVLNEGLEEISYEAFNNCAALGQITVPSTVTYVGKYAFSGCEALYSVRFTGDAPEFDRHCFEDVNATVYYPSNRSGWTSDIMLDYDGTISWVAYTASGSNAAAPARRSVSAETRAVEITTQSVSGLSNSARYLLVVAKSADEPLMDPVNLIYLDQYISDHNGKLTVDWAVDGSNFYIALYGEDGVTVLKEPSAIIPSQPCDGGSDCPSNHFTDVPGPGNWAHAGIDFAVQNSLFAGMSPTTFGPNVAMTRAMLVTVLWRYAGQPMEGVNTFTDVKDGQWYTQAIAWAAENGVVSGMGNGKFNPNGMVTREQMASILYRYAASLGIDTSARADLNGFADSAKVSGWARESVSWAVSVGIVSGVKAGSTVYLQPQGNATRAQVASILMRFIQNVVQ